MKLSLRAGMAGRPGGRDSLGRGRTDSARAGGHDKRAGGAIVLADLRPETLETLLRTIRHRLLDHLGIDEQQGRRLLNGCPTIQAP